MLPRWHKNLLYLINLSDDRIQYLPFEWPEHDGFILDRVDDETSAGLDHPGSNVVYCRHRNNKAIPNEMQQYENIIYNYGLFTQ